MLGTVLLVVLVLVLIGSIPVYPYSREFGWGPSGLLGLILVLVAIFYLLGRL